MFTMKALAVIASCIICTTAADSLWDTFNQQFDATMNITSGILDSEKNLFMIGDNGIKATIGAVVPTIFETLWQTQQQLPNRVFFYLYTRANDIVPQQLYIGDIDTLQNSNFDMRKETKIVTHGWLSSWQSDSCTLVRDAFLQHSDCNVIVVDWGSMTYTAYNYASDRVLLVGKYAAKMVSFLESQGLNANKLTIVGHSLGAHVAGFISAYATQKANYVVGLDPALPNFHNIKSVRDQGKFVEIIHTDSAFWGMDHPIGHADFWPNGGVKQPGCDLDIGDACSHLRSYEYFAESINSKRFVAVKCQSYDDYLQKKCANNSTAIMGGAKPQPGLNGNYYLRTHHQQPFAKGSQL